MTQEATAYIRKGHGNDICNMQETGNERIEQMTSIWDPITVGNFQLDHRITMSPLTRSRAYPTGVPGPHAMDYYVQRAGFGLIVTEGIQPSEEGQGYFNTPGIYNGAQIAGWRAITDAVHDAGARMFFQIMHSGRMGHEDNNSHPGPLVAPSAIPARGDAHTPSGLKPHSVPRELAGDEIPGIVEEFARAASNAIEADADGVQIHGANGYLIHQFLGESSNWRTDRYGGSIENRARFLLEVTEAVVDAVGSKKVSVRLSPGAPFGHINEGPEGEDLYRYAIAELDRMGIALLDMFYFGSETLLRDIRRTFKNPISLIRSKRKIEDLGADIESGIADLAPVGTLAIANPDFVERFRRGGPYNVPDSNTFYGGSDAGYTDYPTLIRT